MRPRSRIVALPVVAAIGLLICAGAFGSRPSRFHYIEAFGSDVLTNPQGIATDREGNVYVLHHSAREIAVFSPSGPSRANWELDNNYVGARAIATGAKSDIFVLYSTGTVERYDLDGNLLDSWSTGIDGFQDHLTTDPDGHVYVMGTPTLREFSSNGEVLATHRVGAIDNEPDDIAAGADGDVYIARSYLNRGIERVSPSGHRESWDLDRSPEAIAVGDNGNVIVAYKIGIQKFSPDGKPLTPIARIPGMGAHGFPVLRDVALFKRFVFAADARQDVVQRLRG